MSMSRKLKKKLIAAAAALTVISAGAANAAPVEEFTATVVFGSATTGNPTNPASYVGPGDHLTLINGMALIANQNTLVNLSALNFSGKYLAFGATSGTALVNQITGGPSTITGIIDKVSPPYDQGTVYLISPYAINIVGGGAVTGINVGQNTALITTMDQFNNFISGGVTPTPTPTPPGPVGPTPEEQAAAALREAQESSRVVDALNLLDATRGNDSAAQAAQEALMNAQGDKEKQPTVNDSKLTGVQDHVYVVQTGAEQNNTGPNLSKLFSGGTPITVKEASSRVRNISKQYLKALQDGDKAAAEQYKQQLKDANALVKALKEQEKNAAAEATKALQGAQQGKQQQSTQGNEDTRTISNLQQLLEDLRKSAEQQKAESQGADSKSSGEAVIDGSQESDALKRLNDIIGEKLLTQEADARARLRRAQTSEERQQIMKELDEIHRQKTEKVNEALKKAKVAEPGAEV